MLHRIRIWLSAFVCLGCLPLSAAAAESPFTLGIGLEFATGDYGTDETTDAWTVPLYLGWAPSERLDFNFVLPYIYQDAGTTVRIGGIRYPHQGGLTGENGGPRRVEGETETSFSTSASQSGLGDADLTIGYILVEEGENYPLLRPLAYIKFPTGDEDDGLGTGAFDFGAGLGLAKWTGDWSWYLEGMYIAPGSSGEFDPQGYWTWLGSLSRRMSDHLRVGAALEGATAPFDGEPDALAVQGRVTWWTSSRTSLGLYVSRGLDDGSHDWGSGLSFFADF